MRTLRSLVLLLAVWVVISVGGSVVTGLIIKSGIDSASAQQQHRLFVAQVSGCERQNVRQVATNKNAFAIWRFNLLFAQALVHPMRDQSAQQRKLTATFRVRLLDIVATLAWTPLNRDCANAPTAVQLPVAFSSHLPGKRDLTRP